MTEGVELVGVMILAAGISSRSKDNSITDTDTGTDTVVALQVGFFFGSTAV